MSCEEQSINYVVYVLDRESISAQRMDNAPAKGDICHFSGRPPHEVSSVHRFFNDGTPRSAVYATLEFLKENGSPEATALRLYAGKPYPDVVVVAFLQKA